MIYVRRVTLSPTGEELLQAQARKENMPPEVFGSLLLENALRERHELDKRFAAAAHKVLNGN